MDWNRVSHTDSWKFTWKHGVLGALLFLLGAFFLALAGGVVWAGRTASGWPTAIGEITSSTVESRESTSTRWTGHGSRSERRTTRSGLLRYRYKAGGASYENSRVYPIWTLSAREGDALERPAGLKVSVYYNPSNPSESCLDPWASGLAWILGLVGFVPALAGGAILAAGIRQLRR